MKLTRPANGAPKFKMLMVMHVKPSGWKISCPYISTSRSINDMRNIITKISTEIHSCTIEVLCKTMTGVSSDEGHRLAQIYSSDDRRLCVTLSVIFCFPNSFKVLMK